MKPESKRSTTTRRRTNDENGGCCSPFNLSSLKHAIEAIGAAKDNSINLASLSAALSAASREMKQREKSQPRRETRKSKKKKKKKTKKKLVIGTKPETHAELQRWFSNLDESFKQLSSSAHSKTTLICEFNTDFNMNHSAQSFRY